MLLTEAIRQFAAYQAGIDRSHKTIAAYSNDLQHFARYLARTYNCPAYVTDVTVEDLEQYLRELKIDKQYAASSRKRKLSSLRALFAYGHRKKLCPVNPAVHIEPIRNETKERIHLTEHEVRQLIGAVDHGLIRLVIETLYYTGMRISECVRLTLTDIDLSKNVLKVLSKGGKKVRHIPIHPKLKELLAHYMEHGRPYSRTEYFFCTPRTGRLSACYVNRCIGKAVQQLGWTQSVSAHTLRHSFASSLVRKNVNIVQIQKLLGHDNLSTTSVYTHARMEDLESAVHCL
jgi:site-specific recombinase XerD